MTPRLVAAALCALMLLSGGASALKLFGKDLPHFGHQEHVDAPCAQGQPCDVTSGQAVQPRGGEQPEWPAAFDWAAPWSPFAQLRMVAPLARQMEEMMSSRALAPAVSVARTAVDVRETPEAFEFVADIPGLNKEHVKLSISDDNVLTISGERRLVMEEDSKEAKETAPTEGQQAEGKSGAPAAAAAAPIHHRVERSYGRFVRSFQLPRTADADKVSATVEKGVLTVRVPKKELSPEQHARGSIPIEWKDL